MLILRPGCMLRILDKRAYKTGMQDCAFEVPLKLASQVIVRVEPRELRPEIQKSLVSWIVKSSIWAK